MDNNFSNKYIESFFRQSVYLNEKYKLLIKLNELLNKNPNVNKAFSMFFSLIVESLQTDIFISLSRIFDIKLDYLNKDINEAGKRSGCNIINFLIAAKELGNIDEDINLLKENEKIINNLLHWRDKFYAHSDKEYFFDPGHLSKNADIKYIELKCLIELSDKIINKYSCKLGQGQYVTTIPKSEDEPEYLFKILNDYFTEEYRKREEMIKKFRN